MKMNLTCKHMHSSNFTYCRQQKNNFINIIIEMKEKKKYNLFRIEYH